MKAISRRSFLKTSVAGAAACSLSPRSWSQVVGANDNIRVAVVGINGRGGSHIDEFSKIKGVRLTAFCDVDRDVLHRRAEKLEGVEKYQDVRKLLENKDVDAIPIATPNHWHALIAIWACQAGKDVYVEKPCSHNLWEGRQLVRAAEKYQRIVQHGTQSRSCPAQIEAIDHLHKGTFGDIYLARGLCFKRRDTIGRAPAEPAPGGVDYDLWTGPAPLKPFTRNRFHYNWHWIWETGNGDLGNQGVHQIDVG